jgi:8-oxo-dGTP diphosphatase
MPATAADASPPVVLVAAVALVDADGRVLLAQRPAAKSMAGLWELHGGKVDAGETPEAALIRELVEELGIECDGELSRALYLCFPHLSGLSPADAALCLPQMAGTPVVGEGQRLAWVRPARLAHYPTPPADTPLIASLRDLL